MSKSGLEHPYFPRDLSLPHYVPNNMSPVKILGYFGGSIGVVLVLMYLLSGKEYSKADSRYLTSDTFTLCMETVTVLLDGPLCLLVIVAFLAQQRHRYVLQAVVSLMQLYGDILYFYTEIAAGFPNSRYGHPIYFWFYFVAINMIWIVLPLICIYESFCVLGSAQILADSKKSTVNPPKRKIKNK